MRRSTSLALGLGAGLALVLALPACSDAGGTDEGEEEASTASSGSGTGSAGSASSGEASSGTSAESSTSASGSSSSTSATTTSSSTGSFVDNDMLGEAMCDIWSEGDCGEGEKCMPYASTGGTWDALKCSPLDDNPKQLGDECFADMGPAGGVDDCGEGLYCYYVDPDTNVGTCIEFCTGSPAAPSCGPDTICTIVNDGVLVLCRPECDPTLQDCQPAGSGCYQATGTGSFTCIWDKSGSGGAYGEPCDFISSCDPGLACLDAASVPGCTGGSCCSNFCDVDEPNACPDAGQGQICEPYYDAPDPGYEHVGVCAVPQPKVEGGDGGNLGAGHRVRGPQLEAVAPYG